LDPNFELPGTVFTSPPTPSRHFFISPIHSRPSIILVEKTKLSQATSK